MERTIKDLKRVWKEKGYHNKPYSDKEITKAINKVGELPKRLVDYYKEVGFIKNQEEHSLSVLSPDELYITKDGSKKFLVYATEMQNACNYAILLKDLKKDNPVIYCSGEGYSEYIEDSNMDYIKGTDEALDVSEYSNTISLLHSLWMFLTNEIEQEFEFEDETIAKQKQLEKKKKQEEKWARMEIESQQRKMLVAILNDEVEDSEELDFSVINELHFEKGYSLRREFIEPMTCNNIHIIAKASAITKLYLKSIDIKDSSFLSSLTNLKTLHFTNCKIDSLEFLKDLKNLKELLVDFVCVNDIECVKYSENLTNLVLRELGLKDISFISSLTKLKTFYAEQNEIDTLANIPTRAMKDLRLARNKINTIIEIGQFKKLEELFLDDNLLTSLEGVQNLKELHHASFANNQIKDVNSLSTLSKLGYVNISSNPIKDLSPLNKIICLNGVASQNIGISHEQILKNYTWLNQNNMFGLGRYDVIKK